MAGFQPTKAIRVATNSTVPIAQVTPPKRMAYVKDPPLRVIMAPPIGDPVSPAKAEMVTGFLPSVVTADRAGYSNVVGLDISKVHTLYYRRGG